MIETLLALPDDVSEALDQRAPNRSERDKLVAAAVRAYLSWPRPDEDAADLAIINANAAELNAEAEDALFIRFHCEAGPTADASDMLMNDDDHD